MKLRRSGGVAVEERGRKGPHVSGSVAQELGDGGPGRRIAFYSSANLNVLDGSSIWIEAVCATLLADPANRVVLPLKVAERRDLITASLRALGRVELVPPPPGTHANRGLKTTEVCRLQSSPIATVIPKAPSVTPE